MVIKSRERRKDGREEDVGDLKGRPSRCDLIDKTAANSAVPGQPPSPISGLSGSL